MAQKDAREAREGKLTNHVEILDQGDGALGFRTSPSNGAIILLMDFAIITGQLSALCTGFSFAIRVKTSIASAQDLQARRHPIAWI